MAKPPPKRNKRKVVGGEGRGIIAGVYHFLKEEMEFTKLYNDCSKCDFSHLLNIRGRTASATGVSMETVSRILKEEKNLPSTSAQFTSPMKKRRKRDNKVDVDSRTADAVRSTIQNFQTVHKEIPTLAKLQHILKEKVEFDGCLSTLRTLLIKLGYQWRKVSNSRKVLTERHDVQLCRLKYLQKISQYRADNRPIVYTDETSVLPPLSAITPFIVVHAGTKEGFINDACLVYKYKESLTTGDSQPTMSYEDYLEWLNGKLLPNLPENAVIVFDNAPYHDTRDSKIPTSNSSKSEMRRWLHEMGTSFDENLLKVELYDIIKKQKNTYISYKIDSAIQSKGFDVLRVPPYHPELNGIENIWVVMKNLIAKIYAEQKITSAEELIHEGINGVDCNEWLTSCAHVEEIEKEYMRYFDCEFEFGLNVEDDSDSEYESSDNS